MSARTYDLKPKTQKKSTVVFWGFDKQIQNVT